MKSLFLNTQTFCTIKTKEINFGDVENFLNCVGGAVPVKRVFETLNGAFDEETLNEIATSGNYAQIMTFENLKYPLSENHKYINNLVSELNKSKFIKHFVKPVNVIDERTVEYVIISTMKY